MGMGMGMGMDAIGWTLRPASAVVISLVAGVCTLLVCFLLDCMAAGTCSCGWLLDKCTWRPRKTLLPILLTLAFIACGTLNFFFDGGVSQQISMGDMLITIDHAPRYDSGRAASFGVGAALGLLLCYLLDPLLSRVPVPTECPVPDERWLPDRLRNAAACGQADVVRDWLSAGGWIDARHEHHPRPTLLMVSALHGTVNVMRLLLAASADAAVACRTAEGDIITALALAVSTGHLESWFGLANPNPNPNLTLTLTLALTTDPDPDPEPR